MQSRREILKAFGLLGHGTQLRNLASLSAGDLHVASVPVEISLITVSRATLRLSVVPLESGQPIAIPRDNSIIRAKWGQPAIRLRALKESPRTVRSGDLSVTVSAEPLRFRIESSSRPVQELRIDNETGQLYFSLGDGVVFGLGEGGPQFDRRGNIYSNRSGQGGYRLRTHGGRVPVPWLIGTAGWALFVHQPYGGFNLTGQEGRFDPSSPTVSLPIDLFVIGETDPAAIMAEYSRLTGHPEIPPLWSFGYQQSHRTLASRDEILSIARTFREKRLPCDAVIYLGTGFCPSGWNTANGSFDFNRSVFPDPKEVIDQLHAMHFKVVLHAVILSDTLRGSATDPCEISRFDEAEAGCYWDMHRKDFALGVDGWWPDEGDDLDVPARLTRNRMYWEGPQLDRPNQRPYALHRNAYAGMQRYGSFLWSGDVYSTWETLRVHVAIGINAGLSGMPYWGTDTGGFVPTKEFTGELYVRWFQFSAFCPLFRAHGRSWKLRLPWQWNTGDLGPDEITSYGEAANPKVEELHNPEVEPICRKYLELRYRMLPYLYSAVRGCHLTGIPIMRALWLHYPADKRAVTCGDQYLWGRDVLVAPVTERAATVRRVYLPPGTWYDFWTEEKLEGGRQIERAVDLSTMPLYVRAGSILPLGPVKQYTNEKVDGPLTFCVYPGADGMATLYEDDGETFNYRRGEWMGLQAAWDNNNRSLALRLAEGSRVPADGRPINVHIVPDRSVHGITFAGRPLTLNL
jgi:alpha-glucosidase (family GH31 glycosyl hydrolase)